MYLFSLFWCFTFCFPNFVIHVLLLDVLHVLFSFVFTPELGCFFFAAADAAIIAVNKAVAVVSVV